MTYEEAIEFIKTTTVTPHIHPDNFKKWDDAVCMAIEALQKQVPMKPKEEDCGWMLRESCPICDGSFDCFVRYCDYCGQRILWEDEQ